MLWLKAGNHNSQPLIIETLSKIPSDLYNCLQEEQGEVLSILQGSDANPIGFTGSPLFETVLPSGCWEKS